ncbi:lipopolysaccharide/colanic/teichoic acid biosynthesis glycosyltransferase [Kribbella antiqua]|uniref:Lipopolysaccharide/colanic/teichoic acid biosynthesis glycosyltransferase n=1 Tax=Kribbella antiqua TaxID=2512217 RepID=A0A4V6NNF8_9ACTN|nr:sugar transferase [Kribbella antiqua]TCO42320.1 lipopolysaccharide/colanic/teichoic acid biosynthesis glycosyltransferase [Kribbella antiqua]
MTGIARPSARVRTRPVVGRRVAKRVLDLVVAVACLTLAGPAMLVIATIVRATTPGPALFRQIRLGRDHRPFLMYKFRTMYDHCPDDIHRHYMQRLLSDNPEVGGESGLYKLEADPRITRVGRFLRRTSLDELPQLVNVLRGEMSLVGPRPMLPWEADLCGPPCRDRFLAVPGLTGLAQTSGRNRLTMRQTLELDLEYVERQSLMFDLLILLRTVPAVLARNGL